MSADYAASRKHKGGQVGPGLLGALAGLVYRFWPGAKAKGSKKVLSLEALERDLERGKPLLRRKRGKVRNLDGSGHKGLADYLSTRVSKKENEKNEENEKHEKRWTSEP